jgi:hypothetical protein
MRAAIMGISLLKKGKPAHDPNSYKKITITNLVGKVIEKIHLTRNSNAITEQQNKLQKGFTQGEMPIIAALILSELIAEAKSNKSPLYVAFMDARKAFDLVWHTGLYGSFDIKVTSSATVGVPQ